MRESSNKPDQESRRRRRRRRSSSRFTLGEAHEQTSSFPGFFVLPRRSADERSAGLHTPLKQILAWLKEFAVVLLALAIFAMPFVYFFWNVAPSWTNPAPTDPAFVFDAKALKTNFNNGDLDRR